MAYLGKSKENSYFFNSSKASFKKAKALRENQTEAESLLWEALRNRQINGMKFRRQHTVSSFIVDFYCHESLLVIELDGSIHDDPEVAERDKIRTGVFLEMGLQVIRFKNEDVINDINAILLKIKTFTNQQSVPSPSPAWGGGSRG